MATAATNQRVEETTPSAGVAAPLCPADRAASTSSANHPPAVHSADSQQEARQPSRLQSILAFSALHEQVRRRKTPQFHRSGDDGAAAEAEPVDEEQFTLDEVLRLVAERAVAITGADGVAIALAENNEIILRAAVGAVRPDLGARIDRDSTFSGACFRTAQIVSCGDTETDARVNLQACRRLGARSMVAVPLCDGTHRIGLLQAFSAQPCGFDDSDARNLSVLAELVLGALTLEDEERFAESAEMAATKLEETPSGIETVPVDEAGKLNEEPEPVNHRPAMLVLMLCMVIASTLAGGVWWKAKRSRLADKIVRMEVQKIEPEPAAAAVTETPAAPSVGMKANTTADNLGATTYGSRAANLPKPRESSKLPMVTGIERSSSADSTTVVLNVEDQVHYQAHRLVNPDRIYFDLRDTGLAPSLAWKTFEVDDAILKRIRVAQPVAGMTRVVLETKTRADFSVRLEPDPYRLVVKVSK
jgi:putative methionine-R-sulfoxide reductase with GAF domain